MLNNFLRKTITKQQYNIIFRRYINSNFNTKTQYQISKQLRKYSISNNSNCDLKYTDTHEWLCESKYFIWKVGLSSHAIEQLGDLIFLEPQYEKGE